MVKISLIFVIFFYSNFKEFEDAVAGVELANVSIDGLYGVAKQLFIKLQTQWIYWVGYLVKILTCSASSKHIEFTSTPCCCRMLMNFSISCKKFRYIKSYKIFLKILTVYGITTSPLEYKNNCGYSFGSFFRSLNGLVWIGSVLTNKLLNAANVS